MKFKLNEIYKIVFWDHVQGNMNLIECILYGKLIKYDKDSLTIVCWDVPNLEDQAYIINAEYFCIARKTIKSAFKASFTKV